MCVHVCTCVCACTGREMAVTFTAEYLVASVLEEWSETPWRPVGWSNNRLEDELSFPLINFVVIRVIKKMNYGDSIWNNLKIVYLRGHIKRRGTTFLSCLLYSSLFSKGPKVSPLVLVNVQNFKSISRSNRNLISVCGRGMSVFILILKAGWHFHFRTTACRA